MSGRASRIVSVLLLVASLLIAGVFMRLLELPQDDTEAVHAILRALTSR